MLSAEAKIPINHLRSRTITSDDEVEDQAQAGCLGGGALVVSASWPRPATADGLVGAVEEWLSHGVRLVFIDGT